MNETLPAYPSQLEMWGGVECSVVRTPWGQYDQLERSGHATRLDDLDRFADLGLRTLRYPLLWERHVSSEPINWEWADQRIHRLRALGIRPIVGLLHHGCGPLPGGFLDPEFVEGLANFARTIAERYPWIDAYTPVNEPLTTARFSGLYGLWHPFQNDPGAFAKIFLVQCQAIRAAMSAIREINPRAQLVQTEDIGKTHSTDLLSDQANWENQRRWLTFDLLNGKLNQDYPLWHYLHHAGIGEKELQSFQERPCPADILGMNHYVTGERLLDERTENYPPEFWGGNGRQAYADVPAVRARAEGLDGCAVLLRELWQRFHQPIAITEVQLACTRDEQLRWLSEVWRGAQQARDQGVDVRAVTAWALVGAFDWDSLLLTNRGRYESGSFDVSEPEPRKTAIGYAVQNLAVEGEFNHPVLETPGWWRQPSRVLFPTVSAPGDGNDFLTEAGMARSHHPFLIIGSHDEPSRALSYLGFGRGLKNITVHYSTLNDYAACWELLNRHQPWAVIIIEKSTNQGGAEELSWLNWSRRWRDVLEALCRRRLIAFATFKVSAGEEAAADFATGDTFIYRCHHLLDLVIDESFAVGHTVVLGTHLRAVGG